MKDNTPEEVTKIDEPGLSGQAVGADSRTPESASEARPADNISLSEGAAESGNTQQRLNTTNTGASGDDNAVIAEMRKKTRRSFVVGGVSALAALGGWRWLRTRREDDGLAWPLRLSHEFNEQLSRDYFSRNRLTPTFSREMASEPRVNGSYGLDEEDFDPVAWKLAIIGLANPPEPVGEKSSTSTEEPNAKSSKNSASASSNSRKEADADSKTNTKNESDSGDESDEADAGADSSEGTDNSEPDLMLTLADIKQLPRAEMVTQLKCIEGWSVIVQWAGARLADLIAKYPPLTKSGDDPDVGRRPDDLVGYVSLETPDGEYYVGLEMESALHPQTLLCYEMNGKPLSLKHGAPLRLVIPVKYGIKNIKRIGKITYTDKRPADYWAERGYDWYSGH